jgi:hypothetical protein
MKTLNLVVGCLLVFTVFVDCITGHITALTVVNTAVGLLNLVGYRSKP